MEEQRVLIFLAVWGGIAAILFYLRGFFQIPGKREGEPPRVSGPFLLLVALLDVICCLLVAPIITLLLATLLSLSAEEVAPWGQVIGIIVLAGALCFLLAGMGRERRRSLFAWSIPKRPWEDYGVGALSWLLAFPLTTLLGQLVSLFLLRFLAPEETEQVAVRQLHDAIGNAPLVFANAISIVLLVPAIEEILFRGFFQTWLKGRLGRGWSISLSALLFAGAHYSGSQGIIGNASLLTPLFLLGLCLGFLYERQRSLWAPIGLHMVYNGFGTLALLSSWLTETGVPL